MATEENYARGVIKIQPLLQCGWLQGHAACSHKGSGTLECKAPDSYYQRCKYKDEENDDNDDNDD